MPKEETKETETVSPEPVEEDFVSEIEEAESSIQKEIAAAQKFEKELDVLQKKMAQNVQDLQEEKNEAEKTKVFDKADLDQIQQVEANPSSEDTESAEESEQEEADIETDVETDAEINNDIETDIAYDTEESENVDSEEAETFFEEEEEDEDDEEWETSADNFVASLLILTAKQFFHAILSAFVQLFFYCSIFIYTRCTITIKVKCHSNHFHASTGLPTCL